MVSIWKYGPDLLGKKTWTWSYNVSWPAYEIMALTVPGEGTSWKAHILPV